MYDQNGLTARIAPDGALVLEGDSLETESNCPTLVLGPAVIERNGDCLVRLEDDVRKCVVYLGWPSPGVDDEIEAVGTGFFVWARTGARGVYLITARHVVEGPGSLEDAPFAIRFNDRSGRGRNYYVDSAEWQFHDDPNVDIAVLNIDPPAWADLSYFPEHNCLSDFKLGTKDIGPGDLAYVVGVFYLLHGKKRNRPFVHTGHVAMMPQDEPIPVGDWRKVDPENHPPLDIEGYLVQAQTLPASSGSPVFVRRSIPIRAHDRNGNPLGAWVHGSIWLMGVWHGAWMGEPGKVLKSITPHRVSVPMGTGVVSPARKLLEIINMPKLVEERNKAAWQSVFGSKPMPQRGSPTNSAAEESEDPDHKERFTALFGAAAKKKPPAE